ncbi:MAG: hypothetical protein ACREA0_20035 [bacterium]
MTESRTRRAGRVELPLVTVRFDHDSPKEKFTVTSLEAPHRFGCDPAGQPARWGQLSQVGEAKLAGRETWL